MSQSLHQELVELRGRAKAWLAGSSADGFEPSFGICIQVELDWPDEVLLRDLNSAWPGGSGDREYPVPHPNKKPESAYISASSQEMWNPKYEYARNRWALLEWLIEQTEPANQLGEKA